VADAVDEGIWLEPRSGITFVRIPAGTFLRRGHQVTLTQDLWMAAHPVTNAQYAVYLKQAKGKEPDYWNDSQLNGERQPVVGVDWDDSRKFAHWIGGDLPTEAQWEYACRGGSTTEYCYGDDEARLNEYAWYGKNSEGRTHDVGALKPNAWGLHDMHGNVWEWCADWGGDYPPSDVADPKGSPNGDYRVLRGGSWDGYARNCRSADRNWIVPGTRCSYIGFRPVRMKTAEGTALEAAATAPAGSRGPERRGGFRWPRWGRS
jgi:formylglycine-generating enzyme required for sulfatase activity